MVSYQAADAHRYVEIPIKYDASRETGFNDSPASYTINKSSVLLQNPSQYHALCEQFDISGIKLPVAIFDPDDPGVVTIEYGVDSISVPLAFVFQGASPPPVYSDRYYFIDTPDHYISMLNTALAAAFAGLAAPPAGAVAPFVTFDPVSQRCSVYGTKAHYDVSLATPVKIFFDYNVKFMFPFLRYWTETSDKFQVWLDVEPGLKNTETISTVDYLFKKQYAIPSDAWNPVRSLLFITRSIPVAGMNTDVGGADGTAVNTVTVLKSFDVNVSGVGDQQTRLLYEPSTTDRKIDLISTQPLSGLDVYVVWKDRKSVLRTIYIPKDFTDVIRLLFERKP